MSVITVKVRMYRHGFGDCFLLQFFTGQKRNFTMLIDCGLKHNDHVPGVSLKNVVDNIKTELRGNKTSKSKPRLDALVVTHEHWDHVSGFYPDQELFGDFSIGKIWMAWTERPDDKEAVLIRKHIHKSVKALKLANEKLKKSKSLQPGFFDTHIRKEEMEMAHQRFSKTLENVSEFYGPLGLDIPPGITLKDKYKISLNTELAMERVKHLSKGEAGVEYFYPGDIIKLQKKLPGVRIYVLGPPKNALLNKDRPSSGIHKEVYFGLGNTALNGFVNGLLAMGDVDAAFDDDGKPFNDVISIAETDASNEEVFKESYFNEDDSWRQINDDWLNMAGALALQLDNDTNNTSLALAIELVDSGKVLLFPGDAQVGSWLSWHSLEWEVLKGTKKEKVTAKQLLENTVFYKAGHHLSHNATLKKLGLELMNSDELVVFIPEKEKQYNGIPYEPLIARVEKKTRGRFIFSADNNYPAEDILIKKPESLSREEWENFKSALHITKLYVEYTLKG